ncbi:hypothetical protein L9F63_009002, partial [Diploptera punctata]
KFVYTICCIRIVSGNHILANSDDHKGQRMMASLDHLTRRPGFDYRSELNINLSILLLSK